MDSCANYTGQRDQFFTPLAKKAGFKSERKNEWRNDRRKKIKDMRVSPSCVDNLWYFTNPWFKKRYFNIHPINHSVFCFILKWNLIAQCFLLTPTTLKVLQVSKLKAIQTTSTPLDSGLKGAESIMKITPTFGEEFIYYENWKLAIFKTS